MAWFNSIAQMFKPGTRRGAAAELRLAQAYKAVFTGHPTRADQEIVLSDLASYTGFFKFYPRDVPADVLRYSEGMRAAFGHIHGQLTLTAEQESGLQMAARREGAADNAEGSFDDD
jgi:hypothetical protein